MNVTIIDATGAPARRNQTVIISGSRITSLGKTGRIRVPKNTRVVSASGKFLIPGLWDMHVHTAHETFIPLYLANGITGIRDMGFELDRLKALHARIERGEMPGPRIVMAGPLVDGPHAVIPDLAIIVQTAADGRRVVADLKKQGVDFIKVYNFLSRETYFAIADEARKQGLPFAGHVPVSVSAQEASTADRIDLRRWRRIIRVSLRAWDGWTRFEGPHHAQLRAWSQRQPRRDAEVITRDLQEQPVSASFLAQEFRTCGNC